MTMTVNAAVPNAACPNADAAPPTGPAPAGARPRPRSPRRGGRRIAVFLFGSRALQAFLQPMGATAFGLALAPLGRPGRRGVDRRIEDKRRRRYGALLADPANPQRPCAELPNGADVFLSPVDPAMLDGAPVPPGLALEHGVIAARLRPGVPLKDAARAVDRALQGRALNRWLDGPEGQARLAALGRDPRLRLATRYAIGGASRVALAGQLRLIRPRRELAGLLATLARALGPLIEGGEGAPASRPAPSPGPRPVPCALPRAAPPFALPPIPSMAEQGLDLGQRLAVYLYRSRAVDGFAAALGQTAFGLGVTGRRHVAERIRDKCERSYGALLLDPDRPDRPPTALDGGEDVRLLPLRTAMLAGAALPPGLALEDGVIAARLRPGVSVEDADKAVAAALAPRAFNRWLAGREAWRRLAAAGRDPRLRLATCYRLIGRRARLSLAGEIYRGDPAQDLAALLAALHGALAGLILAPAAAARPAVPAPGEAAAGQTPQAA